MKRRDFCKLTVAGLPLLYSCQFSDQNNIDENDPTCALSTLFWIKNIPAIPFDRAISNGSVGIQALIGLMSEKGLKFYQSDISDSQQGPRGLIGRDDVVLIKVNAQWKYRGCTNSDLIAELIQAILNHPDGFQGEVVIIENGQGRGSLNCDNLWPYPNKKVHANAVNEWQSFQYLIDVTFDDPRVSGYLLDPIHKTFITLKNHIRDGYRKFMNVSYPCFTTRAGNRIELKEGIWTAEGYRQNLKLINIPVLKHHDTGGSEITGTLKHMYGVLSMRDGKSPIRHYNELGETCGKMFSAVRQPALNIMDAMWVSQASLSGYPEEKTSEINQIIASQDPVALDYWAAKYILYPIDSNHRHHPDFPGINKWLTKARITINELGGLYNYSTAEDAQNVTQNESDMTIFTLEL